MHCMVVSSSSGLRHLFIEPVSVCVFLLPATLPDFSHTRLTAI